jgi:hypothetical protein
MRTSHSQPPVFKVQSDFDLLNSTSQLKMFAKLRNLFTREYAAVPTDAPPPYTPPEIKNIAVVDANKYKILMESCQTMLKYHDERKRAPLCCLHEYLEIDNPNTDPEVPRVLADLTAALRQSSEDVKEYLTEAYITFIIRDSNLLKIWLETGAITNARYDAARKEIEKHWIPTLSV